MQAEQRQAEFNRLFDSIPGKNVEKIRRVCAILCCRENTVRGWRLERPHRMIPEAKLRILQRELGQGELAV